MLLELHVVLYVYGSEDVPYVDVRYLYNYYMGI